MSLNCRSCQSDDLELMIDLGMMPSVGGFLSSPSDFNDDPFYSLKVYVCHACGLVQIVDPIDPDVLFKHYSFSSSTVAPLVEHFKDYALWIKSELGATRVFEFGCNDGILLKQLASIGLNGVGIDISTNITEIARSNGLDVITGYFNECNAGSIVESHGKFDVVTGSNAFAHNANPAEIIIASKKILTDDGIFCLEVMYAGDLLQQFQWDTLYHEHLTFYSLKTLEGLLSRHGLYVFDAIRIPMHGGSLRIAASRDKNKTKSQTYNQLSSFEHEMNLNKSETWMNFGRDAARKIKVVRDVIGSLSVNHTVAAYGAAGKAAMWFNSADMSYLKYVVDGSPLRAGKFMPGTHTPIVFPEEFKKDPVDIIFISAWNYAAVISEKERWYEGVWAVPLPELRFF
jgi:SAM-dependent methyltransferase